ncbi:Dipeptidyl-peptidase 5 [Cryptotrichosporon argae]
MLSWLILVCCGVAAARPAQQPFVDIIGLPWDQVLSVPEIDAWALNTVGDAAVIRTSTLDPASETTRHELHLLAINAQFTVPSVLQGAAHPDALYTFLSDDRFATLAPTADAWEISLQTLNYTSLPPAYPPSASEPVVLLSIELDEPPRAFLYAAETESLVVVTSRTVRVVGNGRERRIDLHGLTIDEAAVSSDRLALVAYDASARPPTSTRSFLYALDLGSGALAQVSTGAGGAVSSPALSDDGKLAWLEQRDDGNLRGQRRLWLADGAHVWEVALEFELSPTKVVWSREGVALNLLTLAGPDQAFYHLWTPNATSGPATPTRIPSAGTIHAAEHIGVTPLNHSHFIAIKSSLTAGPELWVVSHSPFADPTDNFEEIRLTSFSERALGATSSLRAGRRFAFDNDRGTTIHGRVFLPPRENPPVIFLIHGDGPSSAQDRWERYWNPSVVVDPTGTEGYSDSFTQARRFDWGGQPVADLRLGLAHALDRFGLDRARVYVFGCGAFGGFAVHWIQGAGWNVTGVVAHDGIVSPTRWARDTAVKAVPHWEFGPLSYRRDSPYYQFDPEHATRSWATPELVITDGANDAVSGPELESITAHGLLQSRGIKTRLVRSRSILDWWRAIDDFLTW